MEKGGDKSEALHGVFKSVEAYHHSLESLEYGPHAAVE